MGRTVAGALAAWHGGVGQLMPALPQGITVVSIDGQWLKLLHAVGRSPRRTVTVRLARPIETLGGTELSDWLRQACAEANLVPGTVLIANPSHLTTTRMFTLPSTDRAELHDIIELQAEKHTPYAKDEILTDFRIIEADRAGYSRVLLIISHQEVVHRALNVIEGLGWPLERVGLELEGLVNWYQSVRPAESDEDAVLVADVDHDTTTVVIVHRGQPLFHRSLAIGASHLARDPEQAAAFVAEVQRSLDTFESEGTALSVRRVVLTGGLDPASSLAADVQRSIEAPTSIISAFERCPLSDGAASAAAPEHVSFASLVGLASSPSTVDLTPKALKLHRTFEIRSRALVGLGCQVIGILLLCSCLMMAKAYKDQRYHAGLLQASETVAREAGEVDTMLTQLEAMKRWRRTQPLLLEAVAALNAQTPTAIQWESLAYLKADRISVKGLSTDMPRVFEMAEELKRLPLFSSVDVRQATKRRVGNQDITEFELLCTFAPLDSEQGDA